MSASSKSDRAAYDAPTGRLLIRFGSIDGIGTLEDWEEFIRFAQREMLRVRMRAYEGDDWELSPEPINEF
ncbi:hypothetical protein ACO2RV_17205 [Ancylobacter sp. VNQ12]|uniref:hypothetical protein n=1 Tax=Ancylobacter sp. VNQ12 TaxID=3400920 RepID=UPI003C0D15EF